MAERIEQIKSMLEKDPRDLFLHYSLAMEYASSERFDEAAEAFGKCLKLDDEYLPAYVEAGKSLRSAGRLDEARDIFAAALDVAIAKGETHMRDFVQQQLDAFPREQ